jgi:hypothetical protein
VYTSFIKDTNSRSCSAAIRNDKGQFTFLAWDVIPFSESVEAAKSIACLVGVKQVLMIVHTGIIVERDCASLIKNLSNSERHSPRIATASC